MRRARLIFGICAAMILAPAAAAAQSAAPSGRAASVVWSPRLGISNPAAPAAAVPAAALMPASLRHRGPGVAFMLVGAAGIVTGLLVDEGIVTIAGAGVGLYGLYLYLK